MTGINRRLRPLNYWWGYHHIDGSIQAKRAFDTVRQDMNEARSSPFVVRVYGRFAAANREQALAILREKLL